MVHPFIFPHQIDQGLLWMYDSITPHQLKQEILRLFDRYSPQNGNVVDYLKDYLGWRYDRQFLSSDDEESFDEDADNGPSLLLFRSLHHILQGKINNGVYKCAPAA